jgi:hypothetical protein
MIQYPKLLVVYFLCFFQEGLKPPTRTLCTLFVSKKKLSDTPEKRPRKGVVLILLISLDLSFSNFSLTVVPQPSSLPRWLGSFAMSSAMEKLFAVPLVGKCCEMLMEGDPNLKHISILFGSISLDYFAMGMMSTYEETGVKTDQDEAVQINSKNSL